MCLCLLAAAAAPTLGLTATSRIRPLEVVAQPRLASAPRCSHVEQQHPPLFGNPLGLRSACAADESLVPDHVSKTDHAMDEEDFALNAGVSVSLLVLTAALHASPAEAASAAGAAAAVVATPQEVLDKALKRALGGGVSGALAGVAQVVLLMWLRTTMNYQYRNGGGTRDALTALYEEGGIPRFYRGVQFALLQTPLSRFGDTAANTGVLALLATSDLPVGIRTACASAVAALWRIGLTPLDTMKTTLQVKGEEGYTQVTDKIKAEGLPVLFQGALGNALASFVGNVRARPPP